MTDFSFDNQFENNSSGNLSFNRYFSMDSYREAVLPVLLEDETGNNLLVSIITDTALKCSPDWLMSTVSDAAGRTRLIAFCSKPFNMLLATPAGIECSDIVLEFLADEICKIGFTPPGVFARENSAKLFSKIYKDISALQGQRVLLDERPMILMKLTELADFPKPPGRCRVLCDADLALTSFWEQAFSIECRIPVFSFDENKERIKTRIGRDIHYIWENEHGTPVSQAVFGRDTPCGAVINWVYTPPEFRGHGYATAVVGELTRSVLARGKQFCCLFAESGNMVSRSIYNKLGFVDIADFCEIHFLKS